MSHGLKPFKKMKPMTMMPLTFKPLSEKFVDEAFWIEAMAPNTEPLTIQVEDRPVLNRSFGCFEFPKGMLFESDVLHEKLCFPTLGDWETPT